MILTGYWNTYPYTVVFFLAVCLLIAILNYFSIRRFDDFPPAGMFPRVSILVPARNEEANIRACVESLLAQNYPDFEILVLDDNSTDQTLAILIQMAKYDSRLLVLQGEPLPAGWLGKNWACHQLSLKASGELILFTDADTRHKVDTLSKSVSALIALQADLVTAFPREEMLTWGERLTVPILSFSIYCFFPILLANKFHLPAFSVTIGQFMLFRHSAFAAIGGYEVVRANLVDDIMLGRNIITHGFNWQLLDATRYVTCRMYRDYSSAMEGFTKNIFAFFDHHIFLYAISWYWISVSFLLPPLVLLFPGFSVSMNFPVQIAMVAILQAISLFGLAYYRFRFPAYLVLFYPLSLLIFALIALRSLVYTLLGLGSWKGRTLVPPSFRL